MIRDKDVLQIMRDKVAAGTARQEIVALFEAQFAKTGRLELNPTLLRSLNLRKITEPIYEVIQET